MKDLYKILGVDSSCDQKIIRSAYKAKAREKHPDKAGGSTEEFQALNEAYSILRDPDKRAKYDAGESTDDKTPVEKVAEARLGTLFQQAITSAQDHVDMVEAILKASTSGAMKMQNDIDELKLNIGKFVDTGDRVEYQGDGNDIFHGQLMLMIDSMKAQISQLSDEIEVTKIVISMLNDYKCKVKEREEVYLSSAGSIFSSQHGHGSFR